MYRIYAIVLVALMSGMVSANPALDNPNSSFHNRTPVQVKKETKTGTLTAFEFFMCSWIYTDVPRAEMMCLKKEEND